MRFPADNKIGFFMDFAYWEGVPSDREFVERESSVPKDGWLALEAPGYGQKGDYGNGSIFVKAEDVSKFATD